MVSSARVLYSLGALSAAQDVFLAQKSASDFEELKSCLESGGFAGTFPDVDVVRMQNYVQQGVNMNPLALDVPRIAVEASSTNDVALAVRCAADAGVKVCARSGGNSFTGASFACSEEKTMVLDMHRLKDLFFDAEEQTVTLQPGLTLGQALLRLKEQSHDEATMVTGNCVGVGVGGFILGGGMGALDSVAGLLCDNLQSADFVLSDGTLITANRVQNEDLLWAACGGGGAGVGQLVSATVSSYPTAEVGTGVCTRANFPDDLDPVTVLQEWMRFDQERAHLRLQIRNRELVVFGCFFGETLDSYGSLSSKAGINGFISEDAWSYDSWLDVIKFLGPAGGFGEHRPTAPDSELENTQWAHSGWYNSQRSRSMLLGELHAPLQEELAAALHACKQGTGSDGQECIFIPVGNKVRELPASSTAFAHRSATVSFEVMSMLQQDGDEEWVEGIYRAFKDSEYPVGVYVNYPDWGLHEYKSMYWGDNYDRLLELKQRFDPESLFAALQPIN